MTDTTSETGQGHQAPDALQIGLFDVGTFRFGIEISYLSEVCVAGDLQPVVTSRSDVIGVLNLRGSMIPVLDLMALCGVGACDTQSSLVAIVKNQGRLVGLAVENTRGISAFSSGAMHNLYRDSRDISQLVTRSVLDDGASVNIVEVDRIFAQPDIPTCAVQNDVQRQDAVSGQTAFLTFEAGGAMFGIEATSIFGTVPRQTITAGAVSGSACLGLIKYLGRDVPVVDCAPLIGLGTAVESAQPEVVVIRLPDERLFGLAVDLIQRIEFLEKRSLKTPSNRLRSLAPLVTAIYMADAEGQVFVVDAEKLANNMDVERLSQLSTLVENTQSNAHRNSGGGQQDGEGQSASRRCLIYRAGRLQSSDLTDVRSIIERPAQITPLDVEDPSVEGLFSYQGESVLLVNLARHYGATSSSDPARARVLLVEKDQGDVGFLVESVDGIQTSDRVIEEEGDPIGPVARLGRGAEQSTLPFVDLRNLAGALCAQ